MARLTSRIIRRAQREAAKNPPPPAANTWPTLSVADQLRHIADTQDRWDNLRYSSDGLRRLADEVDDALFDERADGWDEGARAAREEDFLDDDFVPTPNPYRTRSGVQPTSEP